MIVEASYEFPLPTVPLYSLITLTLELNSSTFRTKSCSVDIPRTSLSLRVATSPLIEIKVTIPVLAVFPIAVAARKVDV